MFEELMTMLETLGEDVSYVCYDGMVEITLQDFEGFDDDWAEIMRDYDDADAVQSLLDWLEQSCVSREDAYYTCYCFDGFDVQVGYASMDI